MQDIAKSRVKIRKKRHNRIRRIIKGTADRPRLCVKRSLKNMIAQIINDDTGTSLLQLSTQSKEVSAKGTKTEASKLLGLKIGELAKAKGITNVVFDRGGYLYHGRIKAIADSAREAGLQF